MTPKERQLSLFTPQFDERIRRIEIEGVLHFSILDTFEYSGSQGSKLNPAAYWTRAKKRLIAQGSDISGVLDWRPDGQSGGRPTPVAPFKFFLRLAQVVEIKEWDHIRQWMADVAHERLEEEANPALGLERAQQRAETAYLRQGKTPDWIATRTEGVWTRKAFTTALIAYVKSPNFGQLTNDVYKGVLKANTDELRLRLKIGPKHTVRDHLSRLALYYVGIAEEACTIKLAAYAEDEQIPNELAHGIVQILARQVGAQADDIAKALGIDIVSGQRLLPGGAQ